MKRAVEKNEAPDHRDLGKDMDLFHMQEEAAGQVFWHPKGWTLFRALENYIRDRIEAEGYEEIRTPQLYDSSLFKKSGHWDHFSHAMFSFPSKDSKGDICEDRQMALKPMSCPAHIQVFNSVAKSYRDLPIRFAEFGSCIRNEPSGSLHGIMRVRAMTQDDAHIFCREDQVAEEARRFFLLQTSVYQDLGFEKENIKIKLSLRPENRTGDNALWDSAENSLRQALTASDMSWLELPGEGAFYGPKVEFHLTDSAGREWQCGTLQLDFNLPHRLGATYVGQDGQKHHPVMLHRAILGSIERFIGIMLEHHNGRIPLWLAPQQIAVATVTNEADSYAMKLSDALAQHRVRVNIDSRNVQIGYKIREHFKAKVPVIAIVGKRDEDAGVVSIRRLGDGGKQLTLPMEQVIQMLTEEITPPHVQRSKGLKL